MPITGATPTRPKKAAVYGTPPEKREVVAPSGPPRVAGPAAMPRQALPGVKPPVVNMQRLPGVTPPPQGAPPRPQMRPADVWPKTGLYDGGQGQMPPNMGGGPGPGGMPRLLMPQDEGPPSMFPGGGPGPGGMPPLYDGGPFQGRELPGTPQRIIDTVPGGQMPPYGGGGPGQGGMPGLSQEQIAQVRARMGQVPGLNPTAPANPFGQGGMPPRIPDGSGDWRGMGVQPPSWGQNPFGGPSGTPVGAPGAPVQGPQPYAGQPTQGPQPYPGGGMPPAPQGQGELPPDAMNSLMQRYPAMGNALNRLRAQYGGQLPPQALQALWGMYQQPQGPQMYTQAPVQTYPV